MPIHPDAKKILEAVRKAGRPEYWELTPAEAKANHEKGFTALDVERCDLARVEEVAIGAAGAVLPGRAYWPDVAAEPMGAMLWVHGGGHVVGSIDCYDAVCRQFALQSGHLVVAVGYRLAPEHKFPTAVDDTYAALEWLGQHASALGADPQKLMIGGDSAGGNLAAVAAILARDRGHKGLRHQLLIYPPTAPCPQTPSHAAYGEGYLLTRNTIDWFQKLYIRSSSDREDFRFAPLLCADLSRLAPATVVVAECDPLHDEGLAYAQALRVAGNEVEVVDYPGMVHGFLNMGGWLAEGRALVSACARQMKLSLAG